MTFDYCPLPRPLSEPSERDLRAWINSRPGTTLLLTATRSRPNRRVRRVTGSRYGHVVAVGEGQAAFAAAFGPGGFRFSPIEEFLALSIACATVELDQRLDVAAFAECRRYDYRTCLQGIYAYRRGSVPPSNCVPREGYWTCVSALGPALSIQIGRYAVPDDMMLLGRTTSYVRVSPFRFRRMN